MPGPHRSDAVVWWLAAAQLVSWGSLYYSFSLFIGPMTAELGWRQHEVTGALSLGLLVAALAGVPVGRLIDAGHGRALMSGGSVLAAMLLLLWSRSESQPALYLVWAAMGAALATVLYEPAFAVLVRGYGERHRGAIARMTLVAGFASTVFIPLTHWLIVQLGWRDALLVLAMLNLCFCALVHGLYVPGRAIGAAPTARGDSAGLGGALAQPAFWALLLSFSASAFVFAGVSAHLVPMIESRFPHQAAVLLAAALIGPSQVAARLLALGGERWLSARRLGRLGTGALLGSLLLLLMGDQQALVLLFAVAYGMGNGAMTLVRGTSVPAFLGPGGYGAISGALALPATAAKAVAPVAVSLLWGVDGSYELPLAFLTGCAGISWAAFWMARPRAVGGARA